MRVGRLNQEQRGPHVGRHHLVEKRGIGVRKIAARDRRRVVHDAVEPAERLDRRVDHLRRRRRIGQIGFDKPSPFAGLFHKRLAALGVPA